jgi:capsular polysaccharide biosynthesis protein
MLLSYWFIIVLATAGAAGMGWVSWQTAKPVYQSTASVLVTSPGAATTFDSFYGQLNSASRALTFQLLAHTERVTSRVIEQLGSSDTTADLAGRITVLPVASTIFDVVVSGSDPDETRDVAQAVTTTLIDVQRQMATSDGSGAELTQLDEAGVAKRAGSMWRTIWQAAVLGLVFSIVLTIGFGVLRGRLLSRGQLDRAVQEARTESAPTPASP